MRTLVDPKRMGQACILLTISCACFAFAGVTSSGPTDVNCISQDVSNSAIQECVARRASQTEPNTPTMAALLIGAAALGVSMLLGGRAIRRVMTIVTAADELNMPAGQVRRLVDDGILEVYERRQEALYLNPEQVRQLARRKESRDDSLRVGAPG